MKKNTKMDYKKMLEDIDQMVSNDWGFSMIDLKIDIHKTTKDKTAYHKFTQKESQEMSATLGEIYSIAHAVHCESCGGKYRMSVNKRNLKINPKMGVQPVKTT